MKYLSCGCCGCGFQTWKGYVDQDQDKGYGICKDCQAWIQGIENKQLDKIAGDIQNALNTGNAAEFAAMSPEIRREFAADAVAKGLVTFTIKRDAQATG